MLLLLSGHLLGQGPQFGRRQVQIDGGLGGVALQQPVLAGEHHAQPGFQLRLQLGVAPRLGRLPLERIHLAGDFLQNVVDARQVLLGAFQLGFGQPLARLELGDAGGFFDHRAAVLRLGAEDLPDAPLLDDGVALRPQAGAHEDVLDVAQARGAAVDQVFAFAGTEQAPRDGDLAGAAWAGRPPPLDLVRCVFLVNFGIHQGHGHVGHAERLAVAGAGENHVFHAGAAQALGRLFAEHPTDGIADVGLAAAVRTDDGGDALPVEAQLGALAKALESLQFDRV